MAKNNQHLKQIEIEECDFQSRDEFLKWREKILEQYERNKQEYFKEVDSMLSGQPDVEKRK